MQQSLNAIWGKNSYPDIYHEKWIAMQVGRKY